jgi:hypothetical protein
MTERSSEQVRGVVREFYGQVAEGRGGCAPGCCGGAAKDASRQLGYSAEDLASVPEGADMGLGCGNPQAMAASTASSRRSRWVTPGG